MNAFWQKMQEPAQKIAHQTFAREQSQAFLFLPVLLGIGIALYFSLWREPPLWLGLLATALCLSFILVRPALPGAKIVAIIALWIAIGFTAAEWRTQIVAAPILNEETQPTQINGDVADFTKTPDAFQITLNNVKIQNFEAQNIPRFVRIRLRHEPEFIHIGDRVEGLAILRPPTLPNYPGAYDFARDSYFKSIGGIGFILGDVGLLKDNQRSSLSLKLETTRQWLNHQIAAIVNDPVQQSITQALMSGEANAIPDDAATSLRNSGLYHIISISGLHISFVAGLIFFLMRSFFALWPYAALYWPTKKIAAVVALLAIIAYTILVGAPVSTQRSTLMAGLVLFAIMVDRTAMSLRMVATAAIIVLLLEPESLLSASFQLSFAAVTGLVAGYETLNQKLRGWVDSKSFIARITLYTGEILLTSIVAGLATAPFVIYHFQSTQLYGVIANMVGVPLTGFITMPMALLAFLLLPFGLAHWPLHWMALSIKWLMQWSDWVSSWPGSVLHMPAAPHLTLMLFSTGFIMICILQSHLRWAGFIFIIAGFALIPFNPMPDLIIAPQGKVIAARLDDGDYAFQRRKKEEFFTDNWLRRLGKTEKIEWPLAGTRNQNLACDENGCILHVKNKIISIAKSSNAFFEDCHHGSIDWMVSLHKTKLPCDSIKVFNANTKEQIEQGTAAVFVGDKIKIETVRQKRGMRPWSGLPEAEQENASSGE